MSDEFEELEQIPWAALAANSRSPRHRYVSVAAVVVLLVVAAGWMATRGSNAAAIPPPAPAPADATPVTTQPVPAAAPPPTAAVYSEADLMLIDAAEEERLVVMQAEWLVRDLLTVDGDPLVRERIETLLPGIDRPDAPVYVEWVRAFSVESIEPGRYRVEVAYRVLDGSAEGYVRQRPGAFAVEMAIDVGGSAGLVASPEPVPIPDLAGLSG
jgi:hypothetical protein